jgi:ribonucleoside-diphosphate reductase alpha chain
MDKVLEYFNGDELAASVWPNKYRLTSPDGKFAEATPDDMHRRMAKLFAYAEDMYPSEYVTKSVHERSLSEYGRTRPKMTEEVIYNLFKRFSYIVPQGSIMSQLGNPYSIGSLSNCFVLGQPSDSYGGICKKDEEMVHLMKRRGGVGIDLSTLRPSSTLVSNAAKTSTGAASFMHRYSNSTREVAQAGRRGALMLSMDIRHPDVLEFITAKQDLSQVTGANISVMIRDEFMEAVQNDEDYLLRFPCTVDFIGNADKSMMERMEYDKLYTETNAHGPIAYYKRVKAKEYWDKIIECAWSSAEPGIMFIDRHWNYSPDGVYPQYRGVTTNPCSEIFMQMYDACRLIAKNLYNFVISQFKKTAYIDYKLLYQLSYEQQWLGDLLVDLEIQHIDRILRKIESDPEPMEDKATEYNMWKNIREVAASGRRTGNGFTALGDMLAALGLKYDSDQSIRIINLVCHTMMKGELDATIDLAILRGRFSGCDPEMEFANGGANDFYRMLSEEFPEQVERMKRFGRRNVSWSTVAPTGSVSIMTQTTSGLEPLFSLYYMRRKKVNPNDRDVRVDFTDQNGDTWQEFPVVHPKLSTWWDVFREESMQVALAGQMQYIPEYYALPIEELTKEQLEIVAQKSPWYGSTANDIDWQKRVQIQGYIQKYTTHSISSTINLPSTATKEEISTIYMEAYRHGLKGVTVYRDGCRSGVLVSTPNIEEVKFTEHDAPKRPDSLPCKLVRFQNNYEKWVAFIGLYDDRPYEIFTGALESFPVPNHVEEGFIVKSNHPKLGKTYDFHYLCEDGPCVVKGLSQAFHKEYWNYAKLISFMLRHGMPIFYVAQTIEDMSFNTEYINTWKNGVVRALKKFIANGTSYKQKCLECNSENVVFEEGCSVCKGCGSSKCG